MVIDVKQAVQIAKETLETIFETEEPSNIRLEEVVLDNNSDWVITLSYLRKVGTYDDMNPFATITANLSNRRTFKVVKVSKSGGEVKSIKIRENG